MAGTIHTDQISFKKAGSNTDFENARLLFIEYAHALRIDLCFQHFEDELQQLPVQYGAPAGALILAYHNDKAIGCVGIRKLDGHTAELKRMYVQEGFRALHIGRKLLELAIESARLLAYKSIRLDTLSDMTAALQLYRSFGFHEITAYRYNPESNAVFMEKEL